MHRHDVAMQTPQAIVGMLLTTIGATLLLDRLNILHSLVRFWPVAIIGAGIALLLEHFDNPPRH